MGKSNLDSAEHLTSILQPKTSHGHHEATSGPPPALLRRHGLRLHRALRLRVPLRRLHMRRRRRETRHTGNSEEREAKRQEPLRARRGPLGRKLLRADCNLQGDNSGWYKSPVDFDLVYSVTLPRQKVATVSSNRLLELSELSQHDGFTVQNCHLVHKVTTASDSANRPSR